MKKGEVSYLNPENLHMNPAFTNVVTVTGHVKTIYIGGQDAVDASGKIVGKEISKDRFSRYLKIYRKP